jgi:hypothetical protein
MQAARQVAARAEKPVSARLWAAAPLSRHAATSAAAAGAITYFELFRSFNVDRA